MFTQALHKFDPKVLAVDLYQRFVVRDLPLDAEYLALFYQGIEDQCAAINKSGGNFSIEYIFARGHEMAFMGLGRVNAFQPVAHQGVRREEGVRYPEQARLRACCHPDGSVDQLSRTQASCERAETSDEPGSRIQEIERYISHQWGEFQEGMKHGNRFFNESAKTFLDWLFEGLDGYSVSSDEHAVVRTLTPENAPSIYRARTCMTPESVGEITANPGRNLAAPPKDRAGEGRMNPAGVPAFYGALERLTCINELRPPVGGIVVSGEFRLNREVRLLDFGRFEKTDLGPVPSFFDPKCFAKTGRRDFLRYLHDEITLPVLPGMERNYLTTQVIAEYLATHCKPRIDGVIFKSVQEKSGTNIVLFSHVACAAEPMMWRLKGGMGVRGAKSSDAPHIEYVRGSLVYHAIRGVVYDPVDEPLAEDEPETETAPHEW